MGYLLFAIWIAIVYICWHFVVKVADARGHDGYKWGLLCIFFGPVVLLPLLLLPRRPVLALSKTEEDWTALSPMA
jgi:hypothetical protein